ncbi:MAG: hypothetical protein WKG01_25630 [Kofleriaceae bacterium]
MGPNGNATLRVAPRLLECGLTHRRQKETVVSQQKQMFKLLSPMKRKDGGTWWMRAGTGFRNQDNSINIHLDALPSGPEWRFQLRAYDEDDVRKAEERRGDGGASPSGFAPSGQARPAAGASADGVPF